MRRRAHRSRGSSRTAARRAAATDLPRRRRRGDITPDYPIRLSGFGSRRTESEGVTVPIYARALAIGTDADGPAVLIVVDTTGVSDAVVSEIARRLRPLGVRRARLAVAGTHTHTAPMISGVLQTLFGQPVPPEHQANIDRYTRSSRTISRRSRVTRWRIASRPACRGASGRWASRRTAGRMEGRPITRCPSSPRDRRTASCAPCCDVCQPRGDAVAQFHRRGLARLRRRIRLRRSTPAPSRSSRSAAARIRTRCRT